MRAARLVSLVTRLGQGDARRQVKRERSAATSKLQPEGERLGLASGPRVDFPELSASGRTIVAGTGRLMLLTPEPGAGPVADFLAARGDGIRE